jgi:hypothetical protein
MRLDPVEFAGLDQGRDDSPVLCASTEVSDSATEVFSSST